MYKIGGESESVKILSDPLLNIPQYKQNGLWRAVVVDNVDPETRGRLQVRILHLHLDESFGSKMLTLSNNATAQDGSPSTGGEGGLVQVSETTLPSPTPMVAMAGVKNEHCPWADPAFPFGGKLNQGFFALPEIGSTVWVGFEMGYTAYPVWLGAWYGSTELPSEINPADPSKVRLMKTPDGKLMLFDDNPANSRILIIDHPAAADEDVGYIEISQTSGTVVIHRGKYSTLTYSRITMEDHQVVAEIKNGGASSSTLTLTPTAVTVTTTGEVVVNAVDAHINASGNINLGSGGALGVMLDAMIAKFNGHVHSYTPGPGAPTDTAVPDAPHLLVAGTDSSLTVTAKV